MRNSEYFPDPGEAGGAPKDLRRGKRKRSATDARAASTVDRLPPHSAEAEQGVLGCVFLSPHEVMSECEEKGLKAEWFYDLRHQVIWAALAEMYADRKAVDVITVQQKLKDQQQLESVGGIAYLATLPDTVPSAANLSHYLNIVREKERLRRMIRICIDTVSQIYEWEGEIDPLIAQFEKAAMALSEDCAGKGEREIKSLLHEVVDELEAHYNRGKAQITGQLTTGLPVIDKLLSGIGGKNGNFQVLAARPGTGKTAFAMQLAMHAAARHVAFHEISEGEAQALTKNGRGEFVSESEGKWYRRDVGVPVGIFTLEMADRALVQRTLFEQAGVDMQRWREGFKDESDMVKIAQACGRIKGGQPVYIHEECFDIDQLRAIARRWYRQYGVRFFVVDYLQLLTTSGQRRFSNRNEELSYISSVIRRLSKQLNCSFFVLAQMNREWAKEANRLPRMDDLKDSGAIEQDGDLIGLLYTSKKLMEDDDTYMEAMEKVFGLKNGKPDWRLWPKRVNIIFDKNKFGPTGICELLFFGRTTHFEDWHVWLKANQLKAPAAGEKTPDLPSNEELEQG